VSFAINTEGHGHLPTDDRKSYSSSVSVVQNDMIMIGSADDFIVCVQRKTMRTFGYDHARTTKETKWMKLARRRDDHLVQSHLFFFEKPVAL
jgi:hypothetical protein